MKPFEFADRARERYDQILEEKYPNRGQPYINFSRVDRAVLDEFNRAAEAQTRTEFGVAYELVGMYETATVDGLMKELEVRDRLGSMIDRHLKRLLFARGLKSI